MKLTELKLPIQFFHCSLLVSMAVSMLIASTEAAEFSIKPSIAVSEEFTDNVFETEVNKRSDFITRAVPGIDLKYKAPVLEWDLGYNFDYRYYIRQTRSDDNTHYIDTKGHATLLENLIFLDVTDTYKRVSLDITRDVTRESLFVDQSDQNIVTASPFFVVRPTPQTNVKFGYRYVNTWYKDPAAFDRTDHIGFAEGTYEVSPKLNITGGYSFTRDIAEANDYNKHDAYTGFRYEYADVSFIFGQGGGTWIKYSNGTTFVVPFWNAGIKHQFDSFVASANASVKYYEDPLRRTTQETSYSGAIDRDFKRGSAGVYVSYAEYVDTETDILQTKSSTAGIRGKYELMNDLVANLGFEASRYDHEDTGSYTRRFFVDTGLSYSVAKDLTCSFYYRFIDYYSPVIVGDNKQINRVILEFRKTF